MSDDISAKDMESVEAIGKKIITLIQEEMLELMDGRTNAQIVNIVQVAMALSVSASMVTLARGFENYKTKRAFVNKFKEVLCQALDKGLEIKESDIKGH